MQPMCLLILVRRLSGALLPGLVAAFLSATPSQASTFLGEFWDVSAPNRSIDQALNAITGVAPTATFQSTAIDYPNGATTRTSSSVTLSQFLGTDAASIVGNGNAQIITSVFRFTGFIDLIPGQQNFNLGSDDGFRLTIDNNVVSQQNGPRAFRFTELDTDAGEGRVPFELIFYENFGRTGVEFYIDSVLASPAAIPLPNTASLGLLSLAALGGIGMRRSRHEKPLAART